MCVLVNLTNVRRPFDEIAADQAAGACRLAAAAAARPGQHRCPGAGQDHHAVLGRLGPGQRAGRTVEGLHRQDQREDEVRVRALAELRRPHAQRAELQGQAVRPDHRRQPVDRRLGRERPLREAERLLRQGRHQDHRLRARHRDRLCRVAQGHAELLGAAGDGRRAGLDLPQGLVRQARAAGRVQEEAQPRPRGAEDLDRVQAGGRVLLRASRSTARRSTAPTSSPSAAPKASRWA